jgi:aromatic ring hydroxylase
MASRSKVMSQPLGYPRVKEIIEQELGSALIYLNSHVSDFKNPDIRPYLDNTFVAPMATTP